MSGRAQPGWPPGVRELGVGDLKRLGIDGDNQIYWDGRPIEIRKSIVLTDTQKVIAVVVAIVGLLAGVATIVSGFNNAAIFLCARHITALSCPL